MSAFRRFITQISGWPRGAIHKFTRRSTMILRMFSGNLTKEVHAAEAKRIPANEHPRCSLPIPRMTRVFLTVNHPSHLNQFTHLAYPFQVGRHLENLKVPPLTSRTNSPRLCRSSCQQDRNSEDTQGSDGYGNRVPTS